MRLVRHIPIEDSKDKAAHLRVAPTAAFRQEHGASALRGRTLSDSLFGTNDARESDKSNGAGAASGVDAALL